MLVKDINLTINSGDRIAIIGYSGIGKTTLLRTISGLITPLSGEVKNLYNGRGEIGYIPQKLGLVRHSSARATSLLALELVSQDIILLLKPREIIEHRN